MHKSISDSLVNVKRYFIPWATNWDEKWILKSFFSSKREKKYSYINISQTCCRDETIQSPKWTKIYIYILKTFKQELNHEFPYDIVKGNKFNLLRRLCWVSFLLSFLIFCFCIVHKLSDYSYLLSKRTFPRSTCRYSVLLLALAHQYFFPLSLAYLANSSALTEEAVIWRSLISPFCIPSGSTQSISIWFITMYYIERKVYTNFLDSNLSSWKKLDAMNRV